MNPKIFALACCLFIAAAVEAQSPFSFNCTKDTAVNCNATCITLTTQAPNIHALGNAYSVNRISGQECFRPSAVSGSSLSINQDDQYSLPVTLPFDFPFFGDYFSSLVISENGVVSFDINNAGNHNDWNINGDLPSAFYDRAVIMAPFHDLDISINTSPARRISVGEIGIAPDRIIVIDFNEIPLFACDDLYHNSSQLRLYESTGVIEVSVKDKQICPDWNEGKAMIGMQNYNRTKAVMPPGRTATSPPWGSVGMNETWRFIPSNGVSLFLRSELYNLNRQLIATGDTTSVDSIRYGITFNNVCSTSTTDTLVVKSAYISSVDLITEMYLTDTIIVHKIGSPVSIITYPKQVYCNTEQASASPVVSGAFGGRFSATPSGLVIDSISGIITPVSSDTGIYTVQCSTTTSCGNSIATTAIHIVDNTRYVWTGAANSNWENAANWSCNNLPGGNSDVIVYGGNVVINTNVTINSLTVMPGASVTVSPGYNLTVLH